MRASRSTTGSPSFCSSAWAWNRSSAMLSAARTTRRTVSVVGATSAAERIFSSTYAARSATYDSDSVLRIG